ncbi:hypothetical protein [Hyphomicrobium sp. CS1GBMeth3]|uniref:hypothetical protein n=1 Tax=Hyphomicrobium sp. CS1GBMeth3 TaxID=1892845 RepID=UPI0011149D46|nr:hypothetical protein [Hyphomicrobium sp. CS1GBMeth3]
MKVMIGRNTQGRALIKAVDKLNLQDLAKASDDQITAVTNLAWEIKRLFHALISGKASDVLGDLNIVSGAKLSTSLVADLTANIPRDVIISAHQQWLPNLAKEITNGPITTDKKPVADEQDQGGSPPARVEATVAGPDSAEEPPDADAPEESQTQDQQASASDDATSVVKRDPLPCLVHLFGQCLMYKEAAQPAPPAAAPSASALPEPMRAGLKGTEALEVAEASSEKPPAKAGEQSDDLLFPTQEELRAMKDRNQGGPKTADPSSGAASTPADAPAASSAPAEKVQPAAAPVITIGSDVDPESWAEYGGWYRQDYAIYYRPTGHKDKFIYSWLFLTGPQAPKGATSPVAAVFDYLTSKDAQGSCTKCHSVDDIQGKGRVVNFSPLSIESKKGRFTRFIHEPHFGIMDDRGCLTCHKLEKGRPYLKCYEQGDPQRSASNFGAVGKDLCQTCHSVNKARQDCLLCHNYHVDGVVTPIMKTKLPTQ